MTYSRPPQRCFFPAARLLLGGAILSLAIALPVCAQQKPKNEEYLSFNYGQDTGGDEWVEAIEVTAPEFRSDVQGKVTVRFKAPGMKAAKALLWQQPGPGDSKWGKDVNLTPDGISLMGGRGEFTFNADEFPNGPMNVRILTHDGDEKKGKRDIFELQLFNTGGVKWNQGVPEEKPPGAKGLNLIFEDDFNEMPKISAKGFDATYAAHKPRFGDFSGWRFTSPMEDGAPFYQRGTWLKIAARKDERSPKGRTGIIASVNFDGEGVWAKAPFYMECKFTAQSATGTWPAFWTITHLDQKAPGDELDIVEAYGGVGKKNPNHPGYTVVSHFWRQKNPDGSKKKSFRTKPEIMNLGGKSYWSTTFHTYGVRVDEKETVYYFDNIEVLRHPTNDVSRDYPHCFLINLAIGGISGWRIDLSRYGDGSDMYVDWVRVWAEEKVDYKQPKGGARKM